MRSRIVPFDQVPPVEIDPDDRPIIRPRLKKPPKEGPALKRDVGFNRKRRTWETHGMNFDKFLTVVELPDNLDDLLVMEPAKPCLPDNLDEILVPDP